MVIASYFIVLLLGFLDATAATSSLEASSYTANASNISVINDGYAPKIVKCSSNETSFLRKANKLSNNETQWLKKREEIVNGNLRKFMLNSWKNFTNGNESVNEIFSGANASSVPKIALAVSGGSYRAMFSGAGMIAAMDNRTRGSEEHGLGGLLQSSSYFAGLSGGAWLVGTLVGNNWTSIQSIVDDMKKNESIWDISHSLTGTGNGSNSSVLRLIEVIKAEVDAKGAAGFPLSLTDYWGHALAYGFFPRLPHGDAKYTVSDIRELKTFQKAEMPFPLVVADYRAPYEIITPLNSTTIEFNPFEMGSWDGALQSFTDVKYLGTNVSDGHPSNVDQCVVGFDNGGFVLGTSSSIFTPGLAPEISKFVKNSPLERFFSQIVANASNDVAEYAPNPFKDDRFSPQNSTLTELDSFFMVDGGEDEQNIPFVPLLQKERDIDIVFAMDSSEDTADNWPDGSALVATYMRQFSEVGKNIAFPPVPDVKTFEEENLGQRITFFGCNGNELNNLSHVPPLIVYIPNSEHSFPSNTSTYQLSYSTNERLAMIQNGFEAATMSNLTQDPNFSGCVACAVARRKQQSRNISLPKECDACFSEYCWRSSATSNLTATDQVAQPTLVNNATSNVTIWNQTAELVVGANVTSNETWNATTWKPFGNGTVNLTTFVDQNEANCTTYSESTNTSLPGIIRKNSATILSIERAFMACPFILIMMVIMG